MLEREITHAKAGSLVGAYAPTSYRIVVDVESGQVAVFGLRGDETVESYRHYEKGEASIAVNALLNGFQPPRDLQRLDKPSG